MSDDNILTSLIVAKSDYPLPGITFRDITPLLANPHGLALVTQRMLEPWIKSNFSHVVAIEARGFPIGANIAMASGAGLVLARKGDKLPRQKVSVSYDMAYANASLCIHSDAFPPHSRILLVDDVLATGGTLNAACQLVEQLSGEIVGASVLIELTHLNGRQTCSRIQISSQIKY